MSTKLRDVDELGPYWEEDTIYSEAVADATDIIYEGSDDEHYSSAAARKQRYVAAGYRFLQGRALITLSTSLRGPFDSTTGWNNPWTAQSEANLQRRSRQTSSVCQSQSSAATKSRTRTPIASQESHLPSPESLKQASAASTPHRVSVKDKTKNAQRWRRALQDDDDEWQRQRTPTAKSSPRKRKSKGSEWIKKVSAKRQKTAGDVKETCVSPIGTTELFSLSQPPRRGCRAAFDDPLKLSFCSAPDRLQKHSPQPTAPVEKTGRRRSHVQQSTTRASESFPRHSSQTRTTPSQRRSPTRHLATEYSDDELSQERMFTSIPTLQTASPPEAFSAEDRNVTTHRGEKRRSMFISRARNLQTTSVSDNQPSDTSAHKLKADPTSPDPQFEHDELEQPHNFDDEDDARFGFSSKEEEQEA